MTRRIFNPAGTKGTRRSLRKRMPRAEVLLWSKLRDRGLGDLKFRRQFGIGRYVVDFYCPEAKLAVEVDGESHFEPGAAPRDANRQREIERTGVAFVRCTNVDVYENIEGVLERILEVANARIAVLGRLDRRNDGRESGSRKNGRRSNERSHASDAADQS